MTLAEFIDRVREDRDVVAPFVERLLVRLREKHPELELTLDDISIDVVIAPRSAHCADPMSEASIRVRMMLSDMNK